MNGPFVAEQLELRQAEAWNVPEFAAPVEPIYVCQGARSRGLRGPESGVITHGKSHALSGGVRGNHL